MIQIEWTSKAFLFLEEMPQETAFDIIRRIDLLPQFPEMGAKLENRFVSLTYYRQIIIKRTYRIIYDFDEFENRIFILAIQHCRQQLPAMRDLKRTENEREE